MPQVIEPISSIKINGVEHPIDAVTVGGKSAAQIGTLVTSIDNSSTDTQYPSAKCIYNMVYGTSAPTPTPTGPDWVEIAGIKWAKWNVGATGETDPGLFFSWGGTNGYTASQVGTNKNFTWDDYELGNGGYDESDMTKYNPTDEKTVLESVDDAATATYGGAWRMPTIDEFQALGAAVTTAWTEDYQGSGISGMICTDKKDSSKVLFFPAAGCAAYGEVGDVGSFGDYWSSSLSDDYAGCAYYIYFKDDDVNWYDEYERHYGYLVRGILDE